MELGLGTRRRRGLVVGLEPRARALLRLLHLDLELVVELDGPARRRLGAATLVASVPPGQLNAVTAQAAATATSVVAQTVFQEGSGTATQDAGQVVEVAQGASAVATARQTDVSSVAWGRHAAQANVVSSGADTDLSGGVTQGLVQSLAVARAGLGASGAGNRPTSHSWAAPTRPPRRTGSSCSVRARTS
jgi:hypothetical protein